MSERVENFLRGFSGISLREGPGQRTQESRMARIIVETEKTGDRQSKVVMDERIMPVHLQTEPGASQFVERVGWALSDAEEAERN